VQLDVLKALTKDYSNETNEISESKRIKAYIFERATDYGSEGWGFESLQAHKFAGFEIVGYLFGPFSVSNILQDGTRFQTNALRM